MANDDKDLDILLEAQLKTEFSDKSMNREQTITFCGSSMLLSASDILARIQDIDFNEEVLLDHKEGIREALTDILNYLFCTLNELKLDGPELFDVTTFKESMPIITRTDMMLSTIYLITSISMLASTIWLELDNGIKKPIQRQDELGEGDDLDIEEEIAEYVLGILASIDTLCHHTGKGIKSIL